MDTMAGTDDLKSHVEMGSDGGLKSPRDGERDSDGGDLSSPASQDHQLCQFEGGQEEDEGEESKKGGTPYLQAFVDTNNLSEVIRDTLAMGVVEGLMPENKPLNESSDGGILGDDERESSRDLEIESSKLALEPASPDDSAKKEGSGYADSMKESHDEEVRGFALEPTSSEDSVKKEVSNVKSEYVDSVKELCDGRMLGDDQSISMGNLDFEVNEEQSHGFALEPESLENSVKRKEICNGNGEHADSITVETLLDGEDFKTVIADDELKKQEVCNVTAEFVPSDDPVKMETSSNTYSRCFDSVKEIHGGTVGDDVAVDIGNLENELKKEEACDFISQPTFINNTVMKEERDVDSQYVQSVMELHNGRAVGVTRNSDDEVKNEEARDFVSEPALLYDSARFGGSVMKEVSQVIGSASTERACNSIRDTASMVDSSKLAHSLPEDVNCSSETASIDDHVVLGAVNPVPGLKGNKNLLSEEFPGVSSSTAVIGMTSKKNEEKGLPLLDEVGRVSSSGTSSASKENEDEPLCPSDHSGVPIVETPNVSENIKDCEEALGCSEHQPLVNSAPPRVKTSWKNCCGLFGVLTGSI